MRKFNCWNISIVHQYGRFKESRIRSAVFGNSRQFFLMCQNDRADLDDMARDIGLTGLATEKRPTRSGEFVANGAKHFSDTV